jgi:hypothetical protein
VPSKHDPADSLLDIIENAARVEAYLTGMDRAALVQTLRPPIFGHSDELRAVRWPGS